jgi:DNA-directed RNA polymerase subunit RPC12/RpoP
MLRPFCPERTGPEPIRKTAIVNVTYACPTCLANLESDFAVDTGSLACPRCGSVLTVPEDAVAGTRVQRCLVCPSTDLFVRKDFPQYLGVSIVAVGIVGSSIAWYYTNILWTFGILFLTALADLLLYTLVGDALMCYRCHAQYRGVDEMDSHGAFDLETHERYRQMAARLEIAQQVPSEKT